MLSEEMNLHETYGGTSSRIHPTSSEGFISSIQHHDPSYFQCIQDLGVEIIFNNNEALYGASKTLMMVMSGSHSFT